MSLDHASGQDTATAKLAAEIALDRPTLTGALRRSSQRVCQHAGLLEAELGTYRVLVGYLDDALKHIQRRTGDAVDEELLGHLLDRLGVTDADLALNRLETARPNV
jgi:hypothetical protein